MRVFALAIALLPALAWAQPVLDSGFPLTSTKANDQPSVTMTTGGAGRLIVAVSTVTSNTAQTPTIGGTSGLTWTQSCRGNTSSNAAVITIWEAYASSTVTAGTVTVTWSYSGGSATLTVYAYSNAETTLTACNTASWGNSGSQTLATMSVSATQADSVIIGGGIDYWYNSARTFDAATYTFDLNFASTTSDTHWAQRRTAVTTGGGSYALATTGRTTQYWVMAGAEVREAGGGGALTPVTRGGMMGTWGQD